MPFYGFLENGERVSWALQPGGAPRGGASQWQEVPVPLSGCSFLGPPPQVPDAGNDPSLLHPQALHSGGVTPAAPPVAPSPPSCPSAGFLAASPAPGAVTSPGFVAFPGPLLCHCSCSIIESLCPVIPVLAAPGIPVPQYSQCSLIPVPAAPWVPVSHYSQCLQHPWSQCSVTPGVQHPGVPALRYPCCSVITVPAAPLGASAPSSPVPAYPSACSIHGS